MGPPSASTDLFLVPQLRNSMPPPTDHPLSNHGDMLPALTKHRTSPNQRRQRMDPQRARKEHAPNNEGPTLSAQGPLPPSTGRQDRRRTDETKTARGDGAPTFLPHAAKPFPPTSHPARVICVWLRAFSQSKARSRRVARHQGFIISSTVTNNSPPVISLTHTHTQLQPVCNLCRWQRKLERARRTLIGMCREAVLDAVRKTVISRYSDARTFSFHSHSLAKKK